MSFSSSCLYVPVIVDLLVETMLLRVNGFVSQVVAGIELSRSIVFSEQHMEDPQSVGVLLDGRDSVDARTSAVDVNRPVVDSVNPAIDSVNPVIDSIHPTVNPNTPTIDKLLCLGTTFHSKNVTIPSPSHF